MDITIKDNFFKEPDRLRNIALSLDNWTVADNDTCECGWRGIRSLPLRDYKNSFLDDITQQLFEYCFIVRNLENWKYPKWEKKRKADKYLKKPMITTYFHQTPLYIENIIDDFHLMKLHQDFISCAGVIYLNLKAPLNTGTSILDHCNNKMINIQNKYNRFIAYDGYNIHGPSHLFGTDIKTNRLTLTFFIHEEDEKEDYDITSNKDESIVTTEWQYSVSNF